MNSIRLIILYLRSKEMSFLLYFDTSFRKKNQVNNGYRYINNMISLLVIMWTQMIRERERERERERSHLTTNDEMCV